MDKGLKIIELEKILKKYKWEVKEDYNDQIFWSVNGLNFRKIIKLDDYHVIKNFKTLKYFLDEEIKKLSPNLSFKTEKIHHSSQFIISALWYDHNEQVTSINKNLFENLFKRFSQWEFILNNTEKYNMLRIKKIRYKDNKFNLFDTEIKAFYLKGLKELENYQRLFEFFKRRYPHLEMDLITHMGNGQNMSSIKINHLLLPDFKDLAKILNKFKKAIDPNKSIGFHINKEELLNNCKP